MAEDWTKLRDMSLDDLVRQSNAVVSGITPDAAAAELSRRTLLALAGLDDRLEILDATMVRVQGSTAALNNAIGTANETLVGLKTSLDASSRHAKVVVRLTIALLVLTGVLAAFAGIQIWGAR